MKSKALATSIPSSTSWQATFTSRMPTTPSIIDRHSGSWAAPISPPCRNKNRRLRWVTGFLCTTNNMTHHTTCDQSKSWSLIKLNDRLFVSICFCRLTTCAWQLCLVKTFSTLGSCLPTPSWCRWRTRPSTGWSNSWPPSTPATCLGTKPCSRHGLPSPTS